MVDLAGRHDAHAVGAQTLPGGYHLLVGRDLSLLPAARAALHLGPHRRGDLPVRGRASPARSSSAVSCWRASQGIRQTVAAIMQGDLRHRLPAAQSGDELDTLSQTINGMLDHIEQLVARHQQRLELHRARPAHAARGAALAPRGARPHPPAAGGDLRGNRCRGGGRRPRDAHLQRPAAAGGDRLRRAPLRLRARRCRRGGGRGGRVLRAGGRAEGRGVLVPDRRRCRGRRRSGAARAGGQQPHRQFAEVRRRARRHQRAGRRARRRRGGDRGQPTTVRASPTPTSPRPPSASSAATPAAAPRAWGWA